ncbi:MAG: hypothetical protein AAFW00_18705 [Bacteroidota bacterium]
MRHIIFCVGIVSWGLWVSCSTTKQVPDEEKGSVYSDPQVGDTLVVHTDLLSQLKPFSSPEKSEKPPYKIFSWIKADCSSCALKFKRWMEFKQNDQITGAYALYPIVYASSRDMVEYTVEEIIHYPYPVYYDSTNHFFEDNHLSEDGYYQTFLVDPFNKILAIGDPNLDNSYFNTYKRIINGE